MDVLPLVEALREHSRRRDDLDPSLARLVDEAIARGLVYVDCRGCLTTAA